jgi:hypothetical protein
MTNKAARGISPKESHSSSIYYLPEPNSQKLLQFNSSSSSTKSYNLSNYISHSFLYTSFCMLSPIEILLAGGFRLFPLDTVYLFNTQTLICIKLASLSHPRHSISMIKHEDYIYALGGKISQLMNVAERYNAIRNRWEVLEPMKCCRSLSSCMIVKEFVYILGGGSSSVERLDILSLRFSVVYWGLNSDYVIGSVKDDRIYVMSKEWVSVFDLEFKIVKQVENVSGRVYSSPVNLYQLKSYLSSLEFINFLK